MNTLAAKILRQQLFQAGETVVVAVSGGADSVALLDLLMGLGELKLRLVVAHLNHGLRGRDADADEQFVAECAARYGLPFEVERADVAGLSQTGRLSLEEAGRNARYAFLDRIAQKHGATSIALAHHRDDQAETVLIRLLRGAGGSGLSGMANGTGGLLKRPLLRIGRADIEQYLKLRGLSYRTDASNADTAILRNSIRHELLPQLRKYNPRIGERLAATAELLAGDQELLEALTESAFARLARPDAAGTTVEVGGLLLQPRALRLRLYRHALAGLRGDLRRIALSHLEAIDRLVLSSRPNARVKLPGNCLVYRSYGALLFTNEDSGAREGRHPAPKAFPGSLNPPAQTPPPLQGEGRGGDGVPEWQLAVEREGSYRLATGESLEVALVPRPASLDTGSRRIAYLEPAAAPFPWLLRPFAPGDRFTPLGMSGTQKIKELLINEKVPLGQRRRIPLLISADRILWVCGLRMGEQGRVKPATEAVLKVEILEITC